MLHDKVELRIDGYTRIDTIELDYDESGAGTAYIPAYAWLMYANDIMISFSSFNELEALMLRLIGMAYNQVEDYVCLMRRDLTTVYINRRIR